MTKFYTLNKTPSRPVMPVDYNQKSRLDINAKKLDKVRQTDESTKNLYAKLDNLDFITFFYQTF